MLTAVDNTEVSIGHWYCVKENDVERQVWVVWERNCIKCEVKERRVRKGKRAV